MRADANLKHSLLKSRETPFLWVFVTRCRVVWKYVCSKKDKHNSGELLSRTVVKQVSILKETRFAHRVERPVSTVTGFEKSLLETLLGCFEVALAFDNIFRVFWGVLLGYSTDDSQKHLKAKGVPARPIGVLVHHHSTATPSAALFPHLFCLLLLPCFLTSLPACVIGVLFAAAALSPFTCLPTSLVSLWNTWIVVFVAAAFRGSCYLGSITV